MADRTPVVVGIGLSDYPIAPHLDEPQHHALALRRDAPFYPRALCARCAGPTAWHEAAGEGTVHTSTVVRQNLAPPFDALGPYAVATIELDEGPRMMSDVTHVDPAEVRVGLAVTCYAVRVRDDLGIPFWRPAT